MITMQKHKVPMLRFPEFSEEWKEKTLGEISTFFSGGTPTSSNKKYYNGEIPFIGSGKINSESVEQHITEEALNDSSAKLVKKGDLLYALYGATSGAVAISKINGAINQAVLCIRTNEAALYLYQYLLLKKKRILATYLQGGQGNLSAKIIKAIKLRLPKIEEQQKIASFLSTVDTKIEQLSKKKTLLEQYKNGMMQKLFSQETRFKDEQGIDFPDWEEKKLGRLYEITSSKRVFQSEWKNKGIPFYRAREIIKLGKFGFVDNDLFVAPDMFDEYSTKYGAPKEGDLLVTGVGTIGKVYLVPKNAKFYFKDGNIVWLKSLNKVSSIFVKQAFQSRYIQKQISDGAAITTVATYTIDSAKKTKISLPCAEEQQKIANFLSAIDKKIELVGTELELAKTFKKGLFQQMFI